MQHTSIPLTLAFGPQGCMAEVKGRVVAVWCRDEVPRLFCGGLTFLSLSLIIPDRTAEAVLPWLASHQEIEVVSRDRASAYADAVKQALPHAVQVADRYHLIQNLREHLQQFLDRKRTCLPLVEDTSLRGAQARGTESEGALSTSPPEETILARPPVNAKAEGADSPPHVQESERPGEQDQTEMDLSCLTSADRKKKI